MRKSFRHAPSSKAVKDAGSTAQTPQPQGNKTCSTAEEVRNLYGTPAYSDERRLTNLEYAKNECDKFVTRLIEGCFKIDSLNPKHKGFQVLELDFAPIGHVQLNYLGDGMFTVYDFKRKHGYLKLLDTFLREDGTVDGTAFICEVFREFNWTTTQDED